MHDAVVEGRLRQLEPDERVRVDRRAELADLHAAGEMRRRRREQVAAVERARDRLERVGRVRELVRLGDPGPLGRRQQQAVVRPDVEAPLARRAARAPADGSPTPGSTTARCTPTGMYGSVLASTSAPCSTACGGIPCVMSMIPRLRRDPLDRRRGRCRRSRPGARSRRGT